jgi:hypothetical protein
VCFRTPDYGLSKELVISIVLALAGSACHAADMDIRIDGPIVDTRLPSGSGMGWHDGRYFVVGDDSPYLFVLDRKFAIRDRFLLKTYPVGPSGRIAKDLKPDYEAMATAHWNGTVWSLILGSGSEVARQVGYLVSIDGRFTSKARNMGALYRDFAALAGFKADELVNIEALAIANDTAYLFNRGNAGRNLIFRVPLKELMSYMSGATGKIADIHLHEVLLPSLKGVQAGLSGADFWPEIDSLVYSASVEQTDNARDDGAVLGSYLGLIALSMLKDGAMLDLTRSAQLITKASTPVATKVESIVLTHTDHGSATGAFLSDNDDGSSGFFELKLTLRSITRPQGDQVTVPRPWMSVR